MTLTITLHLTKYVDKIRGRGIDPMDNGQLRDWLFGIIERELGKK